MRDRIYLGSFILLAALLLFLGRDLIQSSVLITAGLAFGGTTAVAVLLVSSYRLRVELRASRHELARKEAELNFALEVQKALFPRELPLCNGLEFSAVCVPARGIGGDYYDIVSLPGDRLVFAIADISGKGIPAAILMANFQAMLRIFAAASPSPRDVCSKLNYHLHQVTDASKFATCFYAQWDPRAKRLQYVNAGHNPPILFGAKGAERLCAGGIPLGIFPAVDFEMGEVYVRPGDLLVLYSDGLTEASTPRGEEFGEVRLAQTAAAHREKSVAEIQDRILEAVRSWSGTEQGDDLTLVLARATGCAGEAK